MFDSVALSIQTKDRKLITYELHVDNAWNNELRRQILDFLFRRNEDHPSNLNGCILIVEDHSMVRREVARLINELFPRMQVLQAESAEAGLAIFEQEQCAFVLTDFVMPGMDGIEMTRIMKARVPDQVVLGFSMYGAELPSRFYEAGGCIFLYKTVSIEEFRRVVSYAMRQPSVDILRRLVIAVCDNSATVWSILNECAKTIDNVLRSVGSSSDIAQELLRHKTKRLVADCIGRLGPTSEPVEQLQHLHVQLASIARLAGIIGRAEIQKLGSFISTLIDDLRNMHSRINIALNNGIEGRSDWEVRSGSVVVLAVVELLDNAIAAISGSGHIQVDLSILEAAGMMQVTVTDNGPGVAPEVESQMFEENISTKGPGRGMGLYLVREAVLLLGGTFTYDRHSGSAFRVHLPLAR